MLNTVYTLAKTIVGEPNAKLNEPMCAHTTFRVGGNADLYLIPQTTSQLIALIKLFRQTGFDYYVIGNGSNILVGDKGVRGAVIEIGKSLGETNVTGEVIEAQSGILLSKLAIVAADNGLSGLEFASGIPGSFGGAVYMNAGAYGGEMKDVVESVTYLDDKTEVQEIPASKCEFGYRHSFFTDTDYIILSAKIRLEPKDREKIREYMRELTQKRVSKQPVDKASGGSTFKRPEGYFAAALIEEAGLKGYAVGGASVSEKHSGFVVNNGNATAADVVKVIEHVRETVKKYNGVELETEIKFLGEF